jgi:hypothetical protein
MANEPLKQERDAWQKSVEERDARAERYAKQGAWKAEVEIAIRQASLRTPQSTAGIADALDAGKRLILLQARELARLSPDGEEPLDVREARDAFTAALSASTR